MKLFSLIGDESVKKNADMANWKTGNFALKILQFSNSSWWIASVYLSEYGLLGFLALLGSEVIGAGVGTALLDSSISQKIGKVSFKPGFR